MSLIVAFFLILFIVSMVMTIYFIYKYTRENIDFVAKKNYIILFGVSLFCSISFLISFIYFYSKSITPIPQELFYPTLQDLSEKMLYKYTPQLQELANTYGPNILNLLSKFKFSRHILNTLLKK